MVTLGPRRALTVDNDGAEATAMDLLERFGLADKAHEYPPCCSTKSPRHSTLNSLAKWCPFATRA